LSGISSLEEIPFIIVAFLRKKYLPVRKTWSKGSIGRKVFDVWMLRVISKYNFSEKSNHTCLDWSDTYISRIPSCHTKFLFYYEPRERLQGVFDTHIRTDIHSLGLLKPSFFDLIICTQVFEHIVRPYEAAQSLWKSLKPGGQVIITAPHICPFHPVPYPDKDFFRYTHMGLQNVLKEAGFRVLEVVPGGDAKITISVLLGLGPDEVPQSWITDLGDDFTMTPNIFSVVIKDG
jgi:SAM-dependent methyltransferase